MPRWKALTVLLGEVEGNLVKARAQLSASRRSLASWLATVAQTI